MRTPQRFEARRRSRTRPSCPPSPLTTSLVALGIASPQRCPLAHEGRIGGADPVLEVIEIPFRLHHRSASPFDQAHHFPRCSGNQQPREPGISPRVRVERSPLVSAPWASRRTGATRRGRPWRTRHQPCAEFGSRVVIELPLASRIETFASTSLERPHADLDIPVLLT